MEYNSLSLNKSQLAYLDPAPDQSKSVLLLHGLGSEAASWELQMGALLQAGFRPIAVDLPGFGRSKFYGERWSIQTVAVILKDFVDAMNLNSIHIAGISMGGVVALDFSIRFSGIIDKLVLINTFASLRPRSINQGLYLLRRLIKAQLFGYQSQAEDVASRIFPKPDQEIFRKMLIDQIHKADADVYRAAMRCLGLYNARNKLKDIHVPTLVISGENDTTVSLKEQKELAKGIPAAIHEIIPNAGHAVIIDQPERVNQLIVNFLLSKDHFFS